jgi:hypothetical protein
VLIGGGAAAYATLGSSHHSTARPSGTQVSTSGVAAQTSAASSGTGTAGTTPAPSTSVTTSISTTVAPPPAGACLYGDTGVQLKAGLNLSCPFARNIVTRLAADYSSGSSLTTGPATFEVSSPATGETYSVTCSLAGSNVNCHNDQSSAPDNGQGNNTVTFPVSLVR